MDHALSTPAMAALRARTDALVALFEHVGKTRMTGVPILNPALRVEVVGFEALNRPPAIDSSACSATDLIASNHQHPERSSPAFPPGAIGILITPWFMNLVYVPLLRVDEPDRAGSSPHAVGSERFEFIAAYEPGFGSFEACSLFSPMFEFADQATAVATAQAVLAELRRAPVALTVPASQPAPDGAGRRAFLFGRRAAPSGATP